MYKLEQEIWKAYIKKAKTFPPNTKIDQNRKV